MARARARVRVQGYGYGSGKGLVVWWRGGDLCAQDQVERDSGEHGEVGLHRHLHLG